MSEMLRRWSRLKAEARAAGSDPGGAPASDPGPPDDDVAELPSLDQLGRDSDYTILLRAGIPTALRLAGLRRAWTSDPAIAEFRGFGEYDWDFNAPGYGSWTGTAEEALRLAEAVLGPEDPPVPQGGTDEAGPADPPAADETGEPEEGSC